MSKVIVVGGGASGMIAAYSAASVGHEVTLLEKNEKLGKKVFITGKGRCNVTNAADKTTIFDNIIHGNKFFFSAFSAFDNRDVMDFFESQGTHLKIERGERVFPVSDHSSDIIKALEKALASFDVQICKNTIVKALLTEDNQVKGVLLQDKTTIMGDAVILACGGVSYQSTGSTGDGHRLAKSVGHHVTNLYPALVPFTVKEEWPKSLMGLSLKNITLSIACGKDIIYKNQGEMLFTHFGISGPLVLSASSYYDDYCERKCQTKEKTSFGKIQDTESKVMAYIDLKPALDEKTLDKRLLRIFEEMPHKAFKNALGGLFPAKLIPVMIRLSGVDPEKKCSELKREERLSFLALMKKLPMTITGTRDFAEAIITQGGISLKEVNPSTMESRLCKGLYMVGEMLDLDALTGGFNLQLAWSTGYLAGQSIAYV